MITVESHLFGWVFVDEKVCFVKKEVDVTKPIEETTTTEEVVLKKKPKKPKVVEEESEEITIKKEVDVTRSIEETTTTEEVVIKKKPIEEDVGETTIIKDIPVDSEDVVATTSIKRKSSRKKSVQDSGVDELTIKKPQPEETIEQTLKLKPKQRKSIVEDLGEEIITFKQKSVDIVEEEEEFVENVTFIPKRVKVQQDVEQEFSLAMNTYEEEEISMSGKVKLPKKLKPLVINEEAAEETIRIEEETTKETSPEDINMPLKRRVSKIYNVEEFVASDVLLKEPRKPKTEPRGNVNEEEFFDFKIRRKSSVMPTGLHEESASLKITKEIEELPEGEGEIMFSTSTYDAETPESICLVEGEKVYVLDNTNSEWWFVRKFLTHEQGFVPAIYLRDEPSYELFVQTKLHEKIDKLPIFEKPKAGEPTSAPKFIEKLQPKHMPDGSTVQFECQVEGNPRPLITWFRQTAVIKPSEEFQIFYDSDNVATLIIREVFPEDAGTFTCVAKNSAGFASTSTQLTVDAPLSYHGSDTMSGLSRKSMSRESSLADILEGIPPTFSKKTKPVYAEESSIVTLEVRLVAVPEPDLVWYYNGRPVDETDDVVVSHGSDMHSYVSVITFKSIQKSDEGVYTVVAKNREGEAKMDIPVKVNTGKPEKPSILEPLHDITITEGESAVLSVQVGGEPTPKVEWYKDGKKVKDLQMSSDKNTHTLTLIQCSVKDKGRYSVKVTNKEGTVESTASLNVERSLGGQAPLFIERFEEKTVKEKGTIQLMARVKASPAPSIVWFRNNKPLLASPKKRETFDGENIILELKEADSETDAGDYKVVATNELGSATHGARVTVDVEKVTFTKRLDSSLTIDERETLILECETSHTVSTKWKLNGQEISGMDHRELSQEGHTHKLVIKKVGTLDAGTYSCHVKNQETKCTVTVREGKAEFLKKLDDLEVKEKESAVLEVEVTSDKADVKWFKDGEEVTSSKKVTIEKKGTIRKLYIRNVSVHDEGEYTCALPDQETSAELVVMELPPEIAVPLRDVKVARDEKASFEIELTKGDALVKWYKDGKELSFSQNVTLSIDGKKQKLIIFSAGQEDAGVYACRIGDTGDKESTATLTVEAPGVEFLSKLPEVTLVPHLHDATFQVELSSADIQVKWLKKGKELKASTRHIITSTGTQRKLVIKKVTQEDETEIGVLALNVKSVSKLRVERPVEQAPAIAPPPPTEVLIRKGEDFKLEVNFKALPPPKAEWTVNGNVIVPSKRIIPTLEEDSASLTITQFEDKDLGEYTLTLTNSLGHASSSTKVILLTVPGAPDTPEIVGRSDTSVTLHWRPPTEDGHSSVTGYILESHDKDEFMVWNKIETSSTTYEVTNLITRHEYMFRVAAVNSIGTGPTSHNTRYVVVKAPVDAEAPVIQEELKDSVAGFQGSVSLECVISGVPDPEIKWYKDGTVIKSRNMTYENSVAKFTIVNCTESSIARYTCKATNEAGIAETSCNLLVQELPAIKLIDSNLKSQRLSVKSQWKVEVKYFGYPRPEISWRKNSAVLSTESKTCRIFIDEETSTIAIYSVSREDSGTYTVTATNGAGSTSLDLSLQVLDKPSRPDTLAIQDVGVDSVTLAWTPPLDDGGVSVTKYILEKCDKDKMVWGKVTDVDADISSYTIQKLKQNAEYMFRVVAQNPIGTSEPIESDVVNFKTKFRVPSAPQGPLGVIDVTETSLTIKWQPPEHDGGSPILDYSIEYKESSKKTYTKLATVTETCLPVKDLKKNSSYDFRITARNRVGTGPACEELVVAGKRMSPPSEPTNLKVTSVTTRSVTLQWGPPISNGDTPLIGYVVQKQEKSKLQSTKVVTLDASTLQYTVENLKDKCEYYFQVFAENSVGLGPEASTELVALATHATVPSPPTDPLEIRSLSANAAILEWGVPETDGGAPLEGYEVVMRDVKKTMWMQVGRTKVGVQKLTVKDLQEDHEYFIRIFARNEVGLSEPLENDEPFLMQRPTEGEEEPEEDDFAEKDIPTMSMSTETNSSWMKEHNMDADISSYAEGSLLRRSEYFFKIWYYARSLFK
uniref:Titin n=1 Tax=Cacopsylla melanoneura TaxID=428564 RepID=A0A8D8SBW9_9HEMI